MVIYAETGPFDHHMVGVIYFNIDIYRNTVGVHQWANTASRIDPSVVCRQYSNLHKDRIHLEKGVKVILVAAIILG